MNVRSIDHVELYVGDARQAAYLLCTAYGFRVAGDSGTGGARRTLHLRHGDVHVLLTSALSADDPVADWVARHGDGVAVIALAVPDAVAAYRSAAARGAFVVSPPQEYGQVVTATVAGFGDVVHRLVQRSGTSFWPGLVEPVPAEPDEGLLDVIDHAAICVPAGELDATVAYYRDVFGFDQIFTEYIEVGGQAMASKVVQSRSGGATFTLIEPDPARQAGQIDDFLRWHGGAGVQHLAFRSCDIVTAIDTFAARGAGFLPAPGSYYDALADRLDGASDLPVEALRPRGILVDSDHGGQLFQIFAQSMHVRRTFFLEIIERHGALTFGTSNIKALYEAKERELSAARTSAVVA
jgi:4-hydroxymandelate synthase